MTGAGHHKFVCIQQACAVERINQDSQSWHLCQCYLDRPELSGSQKTSLLMCKACSFLLYVDCPWEAEFNAVLTAGMLCTLSWAREKGFENSDVPIHVYGPEGLAEYIR